MPTPEATDVAEQIAMMAIAAGVTLDQIAEAIERRSRMNAMLENRPRGVALCSADLHAYGYRDCKTEIGWFFALVDAGRGVDLIPYVDDSTIETATSREYHNLVAALRQDSPTPLANVVLKAGAAIEEAILE